MPDLRPLRRLDEVAGGGEIFIGRILGQIIRDAPVEPRAHMIQFA